MVDIPQVVLARSTGTFLFGFTVCIPGLVDRFLETQGHPHALWHTQNRQDWQTNKHTITEARYIRYNDDQDGNAHMYREIIRRWLGVLNGVHTFDIPRSQSTSDCVECYLV